MVPYVLKSISPNYYKEYSETSVVVGMERRHDIISNHHSWIQVSIQRRELTTLTKSLVIYKVYRDPSTYYAHILAF